MPKPATEQDAKAKDAPRAWGGYPPMRESPLVADAEDSKRAEWVVDRWHSLDAAFLPRDRMIEQNIRMLCGQHHTIFDDVTGRFLDIAEYLGEQDELWRQRPTINVLPMWFTLTKARLTENPPIITFQPSSGDRSDADLAETRDTIWKTQWHEAEMTEALDRIVAILCPAGRAHWKSRIDPRRGPLVPFIGPARVPVKGPDGQPLGMDTDVEDAHFDREGNLLTEAAMDPDTGAVTYGEPDGVMAHVERKGQLTVDALSPLEVRGTWGEQVPWHQKQWHIHRTFMSPADVYDLWGLDVEPDGSGTAHVGELQRLMLGSGFFDAASGSRWRNDATVEGGDWVSVYEMWERPCSFPGMEETLESAGGRLTVIAGGKVATDGPRPARFEHCSPIRCCDFTNVPGRPSGTTPQEGLNPLVRAANHLMGQMLLYAERCANPDAFIHQSTGITEAQWTGEPGAAYVVNTVPGIDPVSYAKMPPLDDSVKGVQELLYGMYDRMAYLEGAEGRPATLDPSGQLQKELRANSDRPIAATAKALVSELARTADDWSEWMRVTMDEEEVIAYAGEDDIVRTLTVRRKLFEEGRANAIPDLESMLPESRGERQQRVERQWMNGAFGDPVSPEARATYLSMARFPHMGRSAMPGGEDRLTASKELGRMLRGDPASSIPVLEVYDDEMHLLVLESYMKKTEFLDQPVTVQDQIWLHRQSHLIQLATKMAKQMALQAQQASVMTDAQAPAGGPAGPAGKGPGQKPGGKAPGQGAPGPKAPPAAQAA